VDTKASPPFSSVPKKKRKKSSTISEIKSRRPEINDLYFDSYREQNQMLEVAEELKEKRAQ
jgi:hypothetical protein